jgi:hypothetical protein
VSVAANPLIPSELELIAQLRKKLEETEGRLEFAELKIRLLEERLRLVRIAKYGPGSEKFSDAQLELLELEPGVSSAEVQAESERPPVQPSAKRTRKHPGRQELPANLPRVERVLTCTPEQCVCEGCGKETVVIGHEESSQLDVEPVNYFVLVSKREKSLPGAGAVLAPRLLAAFGSQRHRYASADEVQTYSGIAPVTERSGKRKWVHFRWACTSRGSSLAPEGYSALRMLALIVGGTGNICNTHTC